LEYIVGESSGVRKQPRPIGCWIFVVDNSREALDPLVFNHWVTRRKVSTEDYHGNGVLPNNLLYKILGIRKLSEMVCELGEDAYFIGKFEKAWKEILEKSPPDPTKHKVRILPLQNHRFPRKFFEKGLSRFLGSYDVEDSKGKKFTGSALSLLLPATLHSTILQVFWDTPSDFIYTVGITAAVIFFLYFVFREVRKIF
jgi:hypothetical protein